MINYGDTITLVSTAPDEYGTEEIVDEEVVKAVVDLNTGYAHGNNEDQENSDATVAIDPNNAFVIANYYRLEEFLVRIELYSTPKADAWYKVVKVALAKDTQLCNKLRHIELSLKKTVGVQDVS